MALLSVQGMPRPRDREGAFTSEDWVRAVIRLIGQVRNRCLSRRPARRASRGRKQLGRRPGRQAGGCIHSALSERADARPAEHADRGTEQVITLVRHPARQDIT